MKAKIISKILSVKQAFHLLQQYIHWMRFAINRCPAHHVIDCETSRIRLRCLLHLARRTTSDRTPAHRKIHKNDFGNIPLGFGRLAMNPGYKGTMHIQSRYILTIATLAFALASGLPNVSADELQEAKVTQVIQDVRVLPSNASSRPAAVNDSVRQGTAVQTGVQSRSELTFKDQTITRLGEKTIFSVGQGSRTIDLGSGQFLLYVPKKAGGAKVKAGSVTAAITG